MSEGLKETLTKLKHYLKEEELEGLQVLLEELKIPKEEDDLEAGELLELLGECEQLILLRMEETKRRLEELRRQRERLLRYNEGRDLGLGP